MRRKILPENPAKLPYEIREIVAVAEEIQDLGQEIIWENIGDPVAKGETIPGWIKEIVQTAAGGDRSYAYSPTQGLLETRQFIAAQHNETSPSKLTPQNILFFNGLGDAISNIYSHLHPDARVIGPDPTYPTHAAAEATHAGAPPLTYSLDPSDGWQIDLDDLKEKLKENKDIVAILLVDPGNPTGVAFRSDVLKEVADLARRHDCFIIADEIYGSLRYGDAETARITDFLDDVPSLILHGLSKVVPWPGARCGWVEAFNTDKDTDFAAYFNELIAAKTHEVCSTTLPQLVLPKIFSDKQWESYLAGRNNAYERRGEILADVFSGIDGLRVIKPNGAYYASIVFEEGVLTDEQSLSIENNEIRDLISPLLEDAPLDKRFTYFLLAAEGICVVPLSSGFHSRYRGFRLTLLEPNEKKFCGMLERISFRVQRYLAT